ncbi:MAG TPA: pilin [Pyrinomonadaceae bacterium]|nr:pilin [Pyrinomonadaceae bacterium]
MFISLSKIAAVWLASSLALALLARDCDGQKSAGTNVAGAQGVNASSQNKNINAQTNGVDAKMDGAKTGTWGGQHIALEVTAEGAQVEYDCAHGTVDQKFVTDAEGRFDLRGTHVREHGGPVRSNETPDTHPARFTGQIKGDTMTLTVTETDTKEVAGTFTLVFGQPAHVMKCR